MLSFYASFVLLPPSSLMLLTQRLTRRILVAPVELAIESQEHLIYPSLSQNCCDTLVYREVIWSIYLSGKWIWYL